MQNMEQKPAPLNEEGMCSLHIWHFQIPGSLFEELSQKMSRLFGEKDVLWGRESEAYEEGDVYAYTCREELTPEAFELFWSLLTHDEWVQVGVEVLNACEQFERVQGIPPVSGAL